MDRTLETAEFDRIDLGAVSAETKGPPGLVGEFEGRQHIEGLADD